MKRAMKNILITGPPGVGKTTLVKRLSEGLSAHGPTGFYTEEIREKGMRKGFSLVGLGGQRGVLSHVDIKGPFRVGRYGVDVKGFETFLEEIGLAGPEAGVIIIDEIGKMECFSEKFSGIVKDALDSQTPLIATVALKGGGLVSEVKGRDDVLLFDVSSKNRDSLPHEITGYVRSILPG